MLYTVLLVLLLFFAALGIAALSYALLVIFSKPENAGKRYILLPMGDDKRMNAAKIGYTYERVNFFGEDKNTDIIAVEKNAPEEEVRKMFERYNNIKFVQLGDMPDIMSCFWDS